MMIHFLWLFLFIFSSLSAFEKQAAYPHFWDNPLLDSKMKDRMEPYLMPLTHPLKPILDTIFSQGRVIQDENSLTAAGFIIKHRMPNTHILVVKHPAIEGYLFKIYPDSELHLKDGKPGWYWLCNRCEGAERIRKLIKKKKIQFFTVPDKWIYPLPPTANAKQPIVLIVTDMQLVSSEENKWAWKNVATKKHLDELYYILSHGSGSYFLTGNIPYTKSGKFAFIDTEYPKRIVKMKNVIKFHFLSPEMEEYWKKLIE